MIRTSIIAFFIFALVACSAEERPAEVLPEDQFVVVMADIMIADGHIDNVARIDKDILDKAPSFYKEIFDNHNTTWEQFETSLNYYTDDPEYMATIYMRVMQEVLRIEGQLKPEKSDLTPKPKLSKADLIPVLATLPNAYELMKGMLEKNTHHTFDVKYLGEHGDILEANAITINDFMISFNFFRGNPKELKILYDMVGKYIKQLKEKVTPQDSLKVVGNAG